MMTGLFDYRTTLSQRWMFVFLAGIIVASIIGALVTNQLVFLAMPILVLGVFLSIVDFQKLLYLLYATIPISVAIEVGGGFSTDLPTEPLMIGLSAITIIHLIVNRPNQIGSFLKHPISILLLLHLGWTLISTVNSNHAFIGTKFLLAKIWYVLPFYFLIGMTILDRKEVYRLMSYALIPMAIIIIITLLRHSITGFAFWSINFVMGPWYINHVMYASIIVTLFPLLVAILFHSDKLEHFLARRSQVIKYGLVALFTLGILHSFTRAAIVALVIGGGFYFIIRWRLIRHCLITSLIVLAGGLTFLIHNNQYLEYAPEYTRAISHHKFNDLVSATSKLEDVSTMERAYRWVAGFRMLNERPIVGFGPSSFYSSYKPYTVNGFKTYVSENFDKSGIHCYFLMVFVEQGYVGGVIFLLLCMALLIFGERLYHRTIDPKDKALVMAATIGLAIIFALNLINDIIETDKVGAFFLTYAAILVIMDLKNKKQLQKQPN